MASPSGAGGEGTAQKRPFTLPSVSPLLPEGPIAARGRERRPCPLGVFATLIAVRLHARSPLPGDPQPALPVLWSRSDRVGQEPSGRGRSAHCSTRCPSRAKSCLSGAQRAWPTLPSGTFSTPASFPTTFSVSSSLPDPRPLSRQRASGGRLRVAPPALWPTSADGWVSHTADGSGSGGPSPRPVADPWRGGRPHAGRAGRAAPGGHWDRGQCFPVHPAGSLGCRRGLGTRAALQGAGPGARSFVKTGRPFLGSPDSRS